MASLKDPQATLKLGVYIFKEAGNVTFGNETYEVDKGVVKFVIKVGFKPFFLNYMTPYQSSSLHGVQDLLAFV